MMWRVGAASLAVALVATGIAVARTETPAPLAGATVQQGPSSGVTIRVQRPSPTLKTLAARVERAGRQVAAYERSGERMERWFDCVRPLPVDQVGDPEHRWGFEYDEQDGTGVDHRPALVIHRGKGRAALLLLRFARTADCMSRAPDPNGTGADARLAALPSRPTTLQRLERRVEVLTRRIDKVDTQTEKFDEWESCLSWLPVTELGHEDQGLGYRFGSDPDALETPRTHVAAVDIDTSEWDDPDYELLAFLGRDRPFQDSECGHEPGEGVDRAAVQSVGRGSNATRYQDRLDDLRDDLRTAMEDIEDLLEPVQEFVYFDECMFTVGMRSRGTDTEGYRFVSPGGAIVQRDALSFDMTGLKLPQMDVMAFAGEEPPQIECNEDAGGQDTDE